MIDDMWRYRREGVTLPDGTHWEVKWFGFGDGKFILEALGLSGAAANFACWLCKIHKDDVHRGVRVPGVSSQHLLLGVQADIGQHMLQLGC